MIAEHLGPGVDQIDIGLGADPRQTRRVPEKRARVAVDRDSHEAAGERSKIHARDADRRGIVLPVVGLEGFVVVVGHADPELGKQRRADRAVVVQARTVGFLPTRVFEGALGRAPGVTEDRSLEAARFGETEAAAQAVFVRNVPIYLGVDLIGCLLEWQESEIIVSLRSRDEVLIGWRKKGKDLLRYR